MFLDPLYHFLFTSWIIPIYFLHQNKILKSSLKCKCRNIGLKCCFIQFWYVMMSLIYSVRCCFHHTYKLFTHPNIPNCLINTNHSKLFAWKLILKFKSLMHWNYCCFHFRCITVPWSENWWGILQKTERRNKNESTRLYNTRNVRNCSSIYPHLPHIGAGASNRCCFLYTGILIGFVIPGTKQC